MNDLLKKNSGFTLVELLVIIAIISILSGIATVNIKEMLIKYRAQAAARQIFSDMQFARLISIKRGKTTLMNWQLDGTKHYYELKFVKSGEYLPTRGGRVYLTGDEARYRDVKICKPSDPSAEPTDVRFYPNGTASSGGGVKLSLYDKVYKIYVSSTGTGNIRVISGQTLLKDFSTQVDPCP